MNIILALLITLAGFGAGWTANGWRMGEKVQAIQAQHDKTVADAAQIAKQELDSMVKERDAIAGRLAAIDLDATTKLTKAKSENKILADRLAAGSVGLRIAATCATPTGGSAKSPKGSSLDYPASAVLDPTARQAYSALRDGIDITEATLTACQKSLLEFSQ